MKYYLVGGCVRDWLLGGAVLERDWVVVGGSPQQLISLGYRQVANHFPVFLHPDSGEEYALARKERDTGPGHQDFSFVFTPDISLEEDLIRRDFSINALALSEQILPASFSAQNRPDSDKMPLPASAREHIVDPWGGLRDLRAGVLRHLSSAFADDPLRVLRGLRFVAQLAPWRFSIAPATFLLMRELTTAGALKALPKERVWAEVAKVLSTPAPWLFFQQLAQLCRSSDEDIGDQVRALIPDAPGNCPHLRRAARSGLPAQSRWAAATLDLAEDPSSLLGAPKAFTRMARLARTCLPKLASVADLAATQAYEVMEQTDALRRPEAFGQLVNLATVLSDRTDLQSQWHQRYQLVRSARVSEHEKSSGNSGQAFRKARIDALRAVTKD